MSNNTASEAKLDEELDKVIDNFVFSGLSIHQMAKLPKWFLENLEKNKPILQHLISAQNKAVVERIRKDVIGNFESPFNGGLTIDKDVTARNELRQKQLAALQAMLPTPQQEAGKEDA